MNLSIYIVVLLYICILFISNGFSNPVPLESSVTKFEKLIAEDAKVNIRDQRHLHRKKFNHHYGGGCGYGCGGGGSFAGASAGAFGNGGHGGDGSQAQSQAASFSAGPFSASFASSFSNSGSRAGGGYFDY